MNEQEIKDNLSQAGDGKAPASDNLRRIRLTVAYDGTAYCGWQIQNNGITVEQVLNNALKNLLGTDTAVIGASRTDSGVHALGNVAVFDTVSRIPAEKFAFALNVRLPDDIRIMKSEQVENDWHPRHRDCVKTYEYRILNRRIPDPLRRLYTYFVYYPMDVEDMRRGAQYLVGQHDFKSFCTPRTKVKTTVRTIYSCDVEQSGDEIVIRIKGNGFLYNMVRIIAGTLVKVGGHIYPPEHVKEILEARDRNAAGPKAPAQGLTLVKIDYENSVDTSPGALYNT